MRQNRLESWDRKGLAYSFLVLLFGAFCVFLGSVFGGGWWFLVAWLIILPSMPSALFFALVCLCRYFSAEARYRRILDREEWLAAERRRRQEGGQDD